MENLKDRIKKTKDDGIQFCRKLGKHRWGTAEWHTFTVPAVNHLFDGEEITPSRLDCGYKRACKICGEEVYTSDLNIWKAEYGLGHFECDPATGRSFFVENKQ